MSLAGRLAASLRLATSRGGSSPSGTLRGQVTDPSGAAIANADVVMTPAANFDLPSPPNPTGRVCTNSKDWRPGQYTLNVVAQGFAVYENDNVVIPPTSRCA